MKTIPPFDRSRSGLDSPTAKGPGKSGFEIGLLAFAAALVVVITVLGYLYFESRRAELQQRISQELAAIADLKVGQIAHWREERLANARVAMQTPLFARNVAAFFADPTSEAGRAAILGWFSALRRNYGYEEIALFDAQGNPRLGLPPTADTSDPQLRALLETVPQASDVLISDLHRGSTGEIYIDLIVPLRDTPAPSADARAGEAQTPPATIGVVVFRVDPRRFLYPLIQSWPTPSDTAETLLLRREGDELVYLNELRHRTGTALVLRRLISDSRLPAARAARGETWAGEGVDYRGVDVFAVTRIIPDSPWFIVAKVDRTEIQALLRREAWTVGLIVGALLVSAAFGVGLFWRNRTSTDLRRELAAEREIGRLSRLYAALSQVNQAVVRANTREELLDSVCRVMAEFGQLRLVWIGEHDAAQRMVKPVAWAGEDQGFLTGLAVFTDQRAEGQGPTGTAVREERGMVFNDFAADPHLASWRERLESYRFLSGGAFPIRVRGKVWGSLTVYSLEINFFRSKEIAVLEEAASDISSALDRLEDRAERKQTEDLLKREQALFGALISTIPDNIYFKDRNSRFVRINDNMAQWFGLRNPGEAVGRTDADYFTGEHARQAYEDEQRVMNTGTAIIGLEEKETWPDGRVTWVSTTKVPLRDENGNITGLVGISRDVTAHRQAGEALREAEGRFRATFEQAAVGMAQAGLDGHWTRVNQRFCDIVGYSSEELRALSFQDITHPDDLKTDLDYVRQVLAGEIQEYSMEKRYLRKNHSPVWVNLTVGLVRDQAGAPKYFVSVIEDITERKQAEEAVRESEKYYRGAITAAGLVPYVIDYDTKRFTFMGQNILKMTGYPAEEMTPAILKEIVQESVVTGSDYTDLPVEEARRRFLAGELPHWGLDSRIRTRTGEDRWINDVSVSLRNEHGRVTSAIGVFQDMTERKRAEEAREQSLSLLRATLESTTDGILVVDAHGKIMDFNQRFVEAWRLPQVILDSRDDSQALAFVLDQVADPVAFLAKVKTLYAHPDEESFDLLEFKDSRVFERYSRPQLVEGRPLGRVWSFRDITERKQAEEARRISEAEVRHLISAADCLLWRAQVTRGDSDEYDWRFYIPPSGLYRRLFRADPGEPPFVRWDSLGVPELSEMHARYQQALAEGAPGYVNEFHAVASGGTVWLHEQVSVTRVTERAWLLVGVITDITERKRAEEAVRESRALYQSLVMHIPAGVFRKDLEGRYVFVNDRFCHLKGLSADEILGKTPRELAEFESAKEAAGGREVAPRQRTLVTQGIEHHELIMRTGQSIELEESYPQPDGRVEYFQVVKSPVFGPDGQVIGSQGIQFEITQQRQAQAALSVSEQRFVQFMRNLSGLAYIKDLEGRYLFVNDAYERTFGIPVADWLGKTSDEFFPARVADQRRLNAARTLAEQQRLVTTEEVRTKDGMRFFNTIEFPIVRSNEPLLFGGISIDVTEIKQAQNEVQKLNTHLEQRVRERTAALEAVNRELEAFSYSVSHDLRAPLRAIDGFARILVDEHAGALSAEGHRVLDVVMKESERMGRLIDDLLAFSRISRQSPQSAEIDLEALVGEVYREQAALAPGRRIELQVTALPRANADLALLRQVLVNLIGNAIKYTRPRELARIEVGGSVCGSENVYYVKDNGAGFDPRYKDKLFGVFQRLHSEAEFEGTGVGLALVQRIINRHGGRVWAEGQIDQGATFYFMLPSRPD